MTTKSPTTSVKSREIIGGNAFSQRREVFDKHDTVFLPLPSPTTLIPLYRDADPIVTSNHGKTTSNFKRNAPTHSSMRESKTDERAFDFRPRKYSDNFTSEVNQSDDVDYRHSLRDHTRRLSKLRRDFLTSNLHDSDDAKPFARTGLRASLPAGKTSPLPIKYKIESPNLYKFPFAEPYATPPPVRRVVVDLGPSEVDGKENEDPELRAKQRAVSSSASPSKLDHQKLFEELVKRYSPQRKPIDWSLPPTKPRVIGSVPKSTSSAQDTTDNVNKSEEDKPADDEVFEKKEDSIKNDVSKEETKPEEVKPQTEVVPNGLAIEATVEVNNDNIPKVSQNELDEKNDRVPELSIIQRQISRESTKVKKPMEEPDNIPALIEKITVEGEKLEGDKKVKKVKRKRSFLDKLLGRKKDK